jgi:hypothetical protein
MTEIEKSRLDKLAQQINEEQAAWLAGFLEGEGCFSFQNNGKNPTISASSTDRDVIEKVASMADAGSVTVRTHRNPDWKKCAEWRVFRGRANRRVTFRT